MKISEWLKELLVAGIIGNLSGLFDGINDKVAQITDVVGMTPQQWNGGVFSMVKNLSETVVTPIAGIILTAVACIELLSMMIERNNMRDFDLFEVFKWLMKTTFAVMIVSNTWTIVMGVFEATQSVVNRAAGVVVADTSIHLEEIVVNLEQRLMEMEVGPLFGLFIQSVLMQIISWLLTISIFVIVYGRMIEIYLVTSVQLNNRLVCFDIKKLGNKLKPLAMLILQNFVWNRISANRDKGQTTRYYIDEFHSAAIRCTHTNFNRAVA